MGHDQQLQESSVVHSNSSRPEASWLCGLCSSRNVAPDAAIRFALCLCIAHHPPASVDEPTFMHAMWSLESPGHFLDASMRVPPAHMPEPVCECNDLDSHLHAPIDHLQGYACSFQICLLQPSSGMHSVMVRAPRCQPPGGRLWHLKGFQSVSP